MKEETSINELPSKQFQTNQKYLNLIGAFRYLIKKAFLIFLTIFIGTFLTVIITNRPVVVGMATIKSQLDTTILSNIDKSVRFYRQDNPHLSSLSVEDRQTKVDEYREVLIEE